MDRLTSDVAVGRPVPEPSRLTAPFWAGCRRGELTVQQCDRCGRRFFTPEPVCIHCFSSEWHWTRSEGLGAVYSFSVVHRAPDPSFSVPFVVAAVDLDDGWTMMSNIVDCSPDEVFVGLPVAVRFVVLNDTIALPCFTPQQHA